MANNNYVQINNIFLEPTDYSSELVEIGNTRRTPSGHSYTQTSAKYKTFSLTIEGVSPSMHSNLLYLTSLNRAFEGSAEDLSFTDYNGNSYTVGIPVGGYNYYIESGKEEKYTWELTLEEV
jgi:hypothetical protein